jgi:hypothetical protein
LKNEGELFLTKEQVILLGGDILVIGIVATLGLVNHGELSLIGKRLWPNFLPIVAAWLIAAPFFQLYDIGKAHNPREIWRPLLAMLFAAPFGAWLRGVWLGTAILPVFVLVLGCINALGLLVWRILFMLWIKMPFKSTS